jgi:hypothetical protein
METAVKGSEADNWTSRAFVDPNESRFKAKSWAQRRKDA